MRSLETALKGLEKRIRERQTLRRGDFCKCRKEYLYIRIDGKVITGCPPHEYTGEVYRSGEPCPKCGKLYGPEVEALVEDSRELLALLRMQGEPVPEYFKDYPNWEEVYNHAELRPCYAQLREEGAEP